MDYFFSQILLDLQKRISTEVPEIQFIDQDLGQLGQVGDNGRPPISDPAVLIDFPDSDYTNLADGAQLGAVPISFQLIFDNYSQTWHKAPETVRKKLAGVNPFNINEALGIQETVFPEVPFKILYSTKAEIKKAAV